MSDAFHLVDLTSQGAAVERLLRGRRSQEKSDWLAGCGQLERVAVEFRNAKPTYRFVSTIGMESVFFFDRDKFVFVGDHTTFTVDE
jgi:hypothetical protein